MTIDLSDIRRRIAAADWETLQPRLMDFADLTLRFYNTKDGDRQKNGIPCIEGKDAHSFLNEAIDKTLDGTRKWNPQAVDLYWHLHETIRSLINSHIKSRVVTSRLHPHNTPEGIVDPIDVSPDTRSGPSDTALYSEIADLRLKHILAFRESIAGDPELMELFEALDAGYTTPRDIAESTDLKPERVSELKRKLLTKYIKFTRMYTGPLEMSDLVRERK